MKKMKELKGKKVTRIVELLVEKDVEVFGEILKETKFKTGNKSVTLKVEGFITDVTTNSIEVFNKRWTENGIDCKQWFELGKFEKTFKVE